VVHLNNGLAQEGYLRFSHDGGSPLKRVAMRITPQAWRGSMFRRFRRLATRAESRSRFSGIDWRHTTAWSEELNYFPSIRINLKGREPEGTVEPADREAFCAELCQRLDAWEVVRKAWRREELYEGPHVDHAPDIVLELALEDGYSHSCLRSRGGPRFRRLQPDEYLGGKERGMTGTHRPVGVLLLSVPTDARIARLEDVAPTVLACLGVPGPPMDGRSLIGEVASSGAAPHGRPEMRYTAEQERAIEERLRGLGYFE
jgi:predicted AlkP superfamily phosphohydrolase/phosphomutase